MQIQYYPQAVYYYPQQTFGNVSVSTTAQYYPQYAQEYGNYYPQSYYPYSPTLNQISMPSQQPPTLSITPDTVSISQPPSPITRDLNSQKTERLPLTEKPIIETKLTDTGKRKTPYTDAVKMIENGQLQSVQIEWNPEKPTALPEAKLITKNQQIIETKLPSNIKPFIEALNSHQVRYQFEEKHRTLGQKSSHFLGQVMKDSILPTVILGIGGLAGFGVWRYLIKPLQESDKVEQAIARSVKSFDGIDHKVEDVLDQYPADVQHSVQRFVKGDKDFLLFLGPPGTGKSHLMEAVGKAVSSNPNSITLFANVKNDQDNSIRDLLLQIYSGDKVTTKKAIQMLSKIAGHPVQEVILMANEIEQFNDEINKVIVDGIGNPSSPIRLRILSTGNDLPALSPAANNRIQGGIAYVDYADNAKAAKLMARHLDKIYPGINTTELNTGLQKLLLEYPGHSTRTLVEDILKPLTEKQHPELSQPTAMLSAIGSRLQQHKLNDTEIAYLMRQVINNRLLSPAEKLDSGNKKAPTSKVSPEGVALLNRKMLPVAQKLAHNLGIELLMNGKELKKMIESALEQHISSAGFLPSKSSEYQSALEHIKSILEQGHLAHS